MGQNNAKTQATSKSTTNNDDDLKQPKSQAGQKNQVPHATTIAAATTQTGNLIISIHMLTMNNSNEVNSNTSCRPSAVADCNSNNNTPATDISACSKDQYNNKQQQQSSSEKASTSVYKKFNSKYNKATLITSPGSSSSSANSPTSSPDSKTCDNQSNNNASITNSSSSSSNSSKEEAVSPSSSFRLSSCPFADKISNMLVNKCKFGSSSSSSSSSGTSKVRKGLLGKFKSSTKQKKSRDESDANTSLNTSSSSNDSEKTDTTCTHCSASAHRVAATSDEASASSSATAGTSPIPSSSKLTFNPNNSMFPLPNTSFSITSGGSATTAPAAIILQDSSLLHTNGWYGSLNNTSGGKIILVQSLFDMTRLSDDSLEDCDEAARIRRARQIAEGVEAPPGFVPSSGGSATSSQLQTLLCQFGMDPFNVALKNRILQQQPILCGEEYPRVHSQADYIHCLVPDLKKITSSVFYWGKMDRYEAEKLLEGKPEGTFLLRDSAQEEYLFSVSFRKYGRSLHARIEQFNHQFSFDSHDPGVYTATTVTGLLEHYKDPSCVMFFEPCLTLPLSRNNAFSLQELARATIVSQTTYDGIDQLSIPKMLKSYLKEYHYKQRVHVKVHEYSDI
ncbi:suppressor of cytokine signaling 5 [Culicoides brevitarsis]|uniref:suppressor of cytokine signaling 5 n=1 Tax=Culicoides brevitarsis TaxID=469753 RepID=UPI00307B520A